jgi:Lrp/AsnC family leucine-responsive transcriptional regulator
MVFPGLHLSSLNFQFASDGKSYKEEETFKCFVNKMLKIKDLEKKIILQLLEDGKQPLLQIAKNVGATRQTVAKKIDQFCNSGLINHFVPKLEPEKFGLNIQAYVFMSEDPRSDLRRENEEVIKGFPQVSEFHRLFGKYDSIIKVLVEDKKELTNLVKRLHKLSGVRETETFIVHSTIKNKPEDPFMKVLTVSEK